MARGDRNRERVRKDFSTFTLAASKVMFSGENPYDKRLVEHNYKYFPTNAILLWPFIKIDVYSAQGAWFAINLGLLILAFYSLGYLVRPRKIPWWIYLLVIAISLRAINMNLRLGQWNTSVFCFSIIGLALLSKKKRPGGAALLGLAITLKYMPVIFLAYFAVRGRWRDVAATAVAAASWILLFPLLIMGPARGAELLQQYVDVSSARIEKITQANETSSVSMYSTIYRTFTPAVIELKGINFRANVTHLQPETAAMISKSFGAIFLALFFAWIWRHTRGRSPSPEEELLLLGLCYAAWFIAMPGVRHAQLISLIPLYYGILIAIYGAPRLNDKLLVSGGLAMAILLYLSTSELKNGSYYNLLLEANGVVSWGVAALFATGVVGARRSGRSINQLPIQVL